MGTVTSLKEPQKNWEVRYYKPFVTNLLNHHSPYMVKLDNFLFQPDHCSYYQDKYEQMGIDSIDELTFETIINRSMITHPQILKYLDNHFHLDGCFCCYYTKDIGIAEEFNQLAMKICSQYDIDVYLKSSRLVSDITDAGIELTSQLEQKIKQQMGTYTTIDIEIKPLVDMLNDHQDITTAYSNYGYCGCSNTYNPYIVFYMNNQSIRLCNHVIKNLPIKCVDYPLTSRDRYPYKKIKLISKVQIKDDEQCSYFWDSLRREIEHYFENNLPIKDKSSIC